MTDQPLPDIAAFEALFATHGARMKSLAFNMLRNRSDAEDAVQEAFLKAYSRRHTFRSDAQLWTWVYRILLNACYDAGRRRAVRGVEEEIDPGGTLLQSQGRDQPLRVALQRALAALSPLYREVFLLCEVEGYTHRETAAILDIPEGTSKGRLFEARRQLKDALRGVTTTSATTRVGS